MARVSSKDSPTWTRFCIQKGKDKILMAQKLADDKKKKRKFYSIWTRMTCTSPILDNDVPASQCSIRTGGRLNAPSRARGSPAAATALPPALPEFIELQFWQAPILVTEASGQHF